MVRISIISVVCNFLFFLPAYSQVSWFPVGAVWHYQYTSMTGAGVTKLEVTGEDTLIGTHHYRKILSTTIAASNSGSVNTFTDVLYAFEENRVVTGYNKSAGETSLYDFNAAVGDTLMMSFGSGTGPFIVDSIGELKINGSMLAFQHIRFPDPFDPGAYYTMKIIEGIGSVNSHFFHKYTVIQPFDAPFYYFRCYEDADIV